MSWKTQMNQARDLKCLIPMSSQNYTSNKGRGKGRNQKDGFRQDLKG
jgi:hypothetical protein